MSQVPGTLPCYKVPGRLPDASMHMHTHQNMKRKNKKVGVGIQKTSMERIPSPRLDWHRVSSILLTRTIAPFK